MTDLQVAVAVMAGVATSIASAAIGAWWQRRRGPQTSYEASPETDYRLIDARLNRLEQLAEATALEIERVSEGQRFTTKLLSERVPLGALSPAAPARPAEHHTPH